MKDAERVNILRTFLEGLLEEKKKADARGEPFAIDGVSTIDLLEALIDGHAEHRPDSTAYKARMALLQASPKYTVCIAMTGWHTETPAPKPSTP